MSITTQIGSLKNTITEWIKEEVNDHSRRQATSTELGHVKIDTMPKEGSINSVQSGGIFTELQNKANKEHSHIKDSGLIEFSEERGKLQWCIIDGWLLYYAQRCNTYNNGETQAIHIDVCDSFQYSPVLLDNNPIINMSPYHNVTGAGAIVFFSEEYNNKIQLRHYTGNNGIFWCSGCYKIKT